MSRGPDAPTLSICIVSWNTWGLLDDCLESLFADADARDWEVIVVDNASSDGTPGRLAARYPQVRLVANDSNEGFVRGSNTGLSLARGRFAMLLNPDTRVEPGTFGQLLDFMEENPTAGAAGPRLLQGDGRLQLSCGRPFSLGAQMVDKLLLHKLFPYHRFGRWDHAQVRSVGWLTGACLLVRREVLEQVGPLDPAIFMFYEDVDWCTCIRRAGWPIFYCPVGAVWHVGGQSTRQIRCRMLVISQGSLYYLFQKHFRRSRLHVLRVLTATEMLLRFLAWSWIGVLRPARRPEARERLQAYARILVLTVRDPGYWSPLGRGPGTTTQSGR